MPPEMSFRDRFLGTMEYQAVDRVPNHEAGVWPQTLARWQAEGMDPQVHSQWWWFWGEEGFNLDPREYVQADFQMLPPFEREVLAVTDEHEVVRHASGIVSKALLAGTVGGVRASMDQYLGWPVTDVASFRDLKKRYDPTDLARQPAGWRENDLERWRTRSTVLTLGENCQMKGFYWLARDWMGTENVSYAWYDQPELMHEMMEFIADFTIEVSRPFVEQIPFDYMFINEDMAMKTGPLLGPGLYREFVLPHMRRLVEFFKQHGTRFVIVDSDGNTEPLIPLLIEAGVDGIWPLERASQDTDPVQLRRKYGRDLRLWGAVDKRELAKGRTAIDAHLRTFTSLIEEGGFIPTVDHLVPPDVSYDSFCYYMERKIELLRGDFR